MREQTDEDFQRCLEIGHKGEEIVKRRLTDAGYSVWDISRCKYKGKYLHVDLYVTGEHKFWVEVKVRYSKFWIDTNDIEWLVDWHIKTHIPPFVIFVEQDGACHIISLYKARNKNRDSWIKFEDTIPLSEWLTKVHELSDKWRGIV